jgi:hypothetical protein
MTQGSIGRFPIVLIALLLAISCTGARGPEPAFDAQDPSPSSSEGKLFVRTASLVVSVESLSTAAQKAVEIASQAGGYVASSSLSKDGPARLSLRIPAQELDAVLARLSALGKEVRRTTSSTDVTEGVRDLDAELANKKALRDRLRELLRRASDVADVLAVEAELTRVQTQIDTLEGRLEAMRRDIAFSAVELELTEEPPERPRRILGPLGLLFEGTRWFIVKLFVIRP